MMSFIYSTGQGQGAITVCQVSVELLLEVHIF